MSPVYIDMSFSSRKVMLKIGSVAPIRHRKDCIICSPWMIKSKAECIGNLGFSYAAHTDLTIALHLA